MTCDKCPLTLLCLAGRLTFTNCQCGFKFVMLPPYEIREKIYYKPPNPVMPKFIRKYAVFECNNANPMIITRQRLNCPKCRFYFTDYKDYKLLGPGYKDIL